METTQPSVIRQVTRKLPEWGNLEIVALVTPDGVYFPLKLLCFVFLGQVNDRAQRARVQRDPILQGLTRSYPVETSGGRQRMVCLERLGIGRWINGVEVSRMRPEIRDRFLAFQWELTRLADRLLFGEVASESQYALPAASSVVPAMASRAVPPALNEEQLVVFLDFLARRVGSLEIDMQQIKRWQLALLQAEPDRDEPAGGITLQS